jgi:serine/threonine protein kinase
LFFTQNSFALKSQTTLASKEMFAVDKEIDLMKAIDHPHIVKYFGHFRNKNADICYILMEYCEVY